MWALSDFCERPRAGCLPSAVSLASGIVGAMGSLGGFLMPNMLGIAWKETGAFAAGFWAMALAAVGFFFGSGRPSLYRLWRQEDSPVWLERPVAMRPFQED